ncbi:hypothetical protein KQ302_04935 [Synechococcus sp. CS-602]|uniref:hypothetical protein n=1 Tax=Synechococcaceae TaxID=1890426 RepID=UPI0008FF21FF|nr:MULTISPECIES: hypothetical protein [Synechococcaceae]MCT4365588.1 hypothetical protein [Candidatus Regnicoccus frigidus MAG-AL1]APD47418.1 hypothetical protein BM449_02800 [Synechococcus sp. SynAce01]MCT0202656.1 hypothetical protein [Synechococcus sp. CS-603]MCT0204460.1 hypothetical protein [Synechococcus sp. CS-602]MCT0247302.1 hypothetical protein [Synechococcus sp. CS-601]
MIVLKITNASDVVAGKIGKFLESLTPDAFDQITIEDIVVKKLVENLQQEGLKGEVASIQGIDLVEANLVLEESTMVRRHQHF